MGDRRRGFELGRWAEAFAFGLAIGAGLAAADPALRAARDAAHAEALANGSARLSRLKLRKWREIIARAAREFGRDRIPSVAASATFYLLLALFPALSAFVSLYGLVGDVRAAEHTVAAMASVLPGGAISVLTDQLERLARADHGALGLAFAVSVAISVWSSNAGVKALIDGLNVAYETPERRSFVRLTRLSLAFTIAGIVLAVATTTLLAAAPATLARLGVSGAPALSLLRWPLLFAAATAVISALYRLGPSRPAAHWRWITPGGALAAAAWLAMSAAFSWYVAAFGHYDRTYGSLGAIVGFLTWIWLSVMVVLFGAELNSEIERAA